MTLFSGLLFKFNLKIKEEAFPGRKNQCQKTNNNIHLEN